MKERAVSGEDNHSGPGFTVIVADDRLTAVLGVDG